MKDLILAFNAGSSSLKFGLFGADREAAGIVRGTVRSSDRASALVSVIAADGAIILEDEWPDATAEAATERLFGWIEASYERGRVAAVGHRIVHGGAEFADPVVIDDAVLAKLDGLTPLAPLHQPACLEPVRIVARLQPDLPQVACFDTAFHRTISPPASRYALPHAYEDDGIRRYGFHGLSFESIAAQLAEEAEADGQGPPSRAIVAHLGNGASLCAMRDLRSVDTTMGFSTLDGLVMGTRPGSLDPGILLYLLKERDFPPDRLEKLLYEESGLLGVSGISADATTLLASDAMEAREALELFAFQVARQTAALASTLGGLDRFIFTGGIGEHAPAMRRMIADRLRWLGAELDEMANVSGATRISGPGSALLIERRSTNEELSIARHVAARLGGS